ncbi:multidrug efflux MATE transporter FepA [Planococcus sp. CPCC 101016]|uniref:MATE family efflux transporter n=1 Tax=Planococcus sp. CPCC 101016 TaxID=2599617 RepID=UPI0011B64D80|nr:MATE family efflux transporter [Planococcus sp. CPCC 101016]TWT05357.1 multidrug efflux MATE transporter FepA [Planococcus sp. CPCC 101016]
MEKQSTINRLDTESVGKSFARYLIPSTIGMLLMAVNIVADGIMVGNRLGSVALGGIGIASPVYTLFVAVSLWIGVGAATRFSSLMGAKRTDEAHTVFSHAIATIFIVTLLIGLVAFPFRTELAYLLGANADTYPYVANYLYLILLFGFIYTIENTLSIMVRNDGSPNLSMVALIVTAVLNIALNFMFLFMFNFGVKGAAAATLIAAFVGTLILATHFLKKTNNLRFVRFKFDRKLLFLIVIIGFPSFLSEVGISVFTVSHNVVFERLAGTNGVSAFAVLNYVHSVMLLAFLGMGSAIQPLVSYYSGSEDKEKMKKTLQLAISTVLIAGGVFFLIGQLFSASIVSLFGDFPESVIDLAIPGIRLFFIAYLFMGINFVMMTYYQSTGKIRMAIWITASREILLLLILLSILPIAFGVTGAWLAIPVSECLVLLSIFYYQKIWGKPIL